MHASGRLAAHEARITRRREEEERRASIQRSVQVGVCVCEGGGGGASRGGGRK